jgi:hypothetical protein
MFVLDATAAARVILRRAGVQSATCEQQRPRHLAKEQESWRWMKLRKTELLRPLGEQLVRTCRLMRALIKV